MKIKGKIYVKTLDRLQFCTTCKKVLVRKVYAGCDFEPTCINCASKKHIILME